MKDIGGSLLFISFLFIFFGSDEWIIPFVVSFVLICCAAIPSR